MTEDSFSEMAQAAVEGLATRSIVLAGVGGQGTILAANLLANTLLNHGYDVKTSEVHGMAQRGGSVISMVRFGTDVASPLVPFGEAEALVCTELLEILRNLEYLSEEGMVIASATRVDPLPVLLGAEEYPGDIAERVVELVPSSVIVNAPDIAAQAGDARAANTVLLGILSPLLQVGVDEWIATIEKVVKAKAVDANVKAFMLGRDIGTIED